MILSYSIAEVLLGMLRVDVRQDFGKPNCSRYASPRRQDMAAEVQDAWVHQRSGKGAISPCSDQCPGL